LLSNNYRVAITQDNIASSGPYDMVITIVAEDGTAVSQRDITSTLPTTSWVFAWEDKFRRLLLRFERISGLHYAFKTRAYTMINLRHYCHI
jgi:hypothetical protein